jgi:NAD(P)-dependent dehydrogenase (short-subunit alcohol dehydrogenase family)
MKHPKTVWITGASSGLCLHTAQALRNAGWTVIAGARSLSEPIEKYGIHCLPLDVTSPESVQSFCDRALEISPWVGALVQCAGMLVLGSCEETTDEEYLRVLNTNFLGMVRMNREVLPIMRAQKSGRIVMYSSINGLMGIPFQNAYTASKHAIEGYAEGLQMEVRPFGIQVTLVEPGDHRSGSEKYRPHAARMSPDSPYAAAYESTTAKIHHDETNGSDPDVLGRKIAKMLERKRMPFRRRIASPDQHLAVYLHKFLPARWNEAILRSYYIREGRK